VLYIENRKAETRRTSPDIHSFFTGEGELVPCLNEILNICDTYGITSISLPYSWHVKFSKSFLLSEHLLPHGVKLYSDLEIIAKSILSLNIENQTKGFTIFNFAGDKFECFHLLVSNRECFLLDYHYSSIQMPEWINEVKDSRNYCIEAILKQINEHKQTDDIKEELILPRYTFARVSTDIESFHSAMSDFINSHSKGDIIIDWHPFVQETTDYFIPVFNIDFEYLQEKQKSVKLQLYMNEGLVHIPLWFEDNRYKIPFKLLLETTKEFKRQAPSLIAKNQVILPENICEGKISGNGLNIGGFIFDTIDVEAEVTCINIIILKFVNSEKKSYYCSYKLHPIHESL
jgi:hypothetical protein